MKFKFELQKVSNHRIPLRQFVCLTFLSSPFQKNYFSPFLATLNSNSPCDMFKGHFRTFYILKSLLYFLNSVIKSKLDKQIETKGVKCTMKSSSFIVSHWVNPLKNYTREWMIFSCCTSLTQLNGNLTVTVSL